MGWLRVSHYEYQYAGRFQIEIGEATTTKNRGIIVAGVKIVRMAGKAALIHGWHHQLTSCTFVP